MLQLDFDNFTIPENGSLPNVLLGQIRAAVLLRMACFL